MLISEMTPNHTATDPQAKHALYGHAPSGPPDGSCRPTPPQNHLWTAPDTPRQLLEGPTDAYTCGSQQALRRLLSFTDELMTQALEELRTAGADPGALSDEHASAFEEGYEDLLAEAERCGVRWVDSALLDILG